jgi:predicted MPP superfamily phosphohydrolase
MEDRAAVAPRRSRFRKFRVVLALAVLAALVLAGKAWRDTMADPVVRRATVTLPQLPPGTAPVVIVLFSDIHVSGPDMPPVRLARIVGQVNALKPDLVLIAGDLVSDKATATRHYSTAEAIEPLRELRPRWATVVVPGNHDHWRDMPAIRRELERRGAVVLANEARRFGPVTVGGLDDDYTGRADVPATLRAVAALGGAPVMLSHSPDPFPDTPRGFGLMLAGHTHCGQLRYPWGGSPATMSRYGDRYACGMVREEGKALITTGGLGTSLLPFRFGAPPEIWLIELRAPDD